MCSTILWFRHGLRLHDNPALHQAVNSKKNFLPIFIFDGESAGTKLVGYNRMKFLCESLADLDCQLRKFGGRLFVFQGSPVHIFRRLNSLLNVKSICFEQDCEPIWKNRDEAVRKLCLDLNIDCIECVSHTLWDPEAVIEANGGSPPLTYEMFLHVVSTIGDPPTPVPDVDWATVTFASIPQALISELNIFTTPPKPEHFGIHPDFPNTDRMVRWIGGETNALRHLKQRLAVEEKAFRDGCYLPNQASPDLLGPPTSQSAALRFGCLSVRRFYWSIHNLYTSVYGPSLPDVPHITAQLIWREYFYTMSVKNPFYAQMKSNPICLSIPWKSSSEVKGQFERWCIGLTGYPFIDAAMRQLLLEGWIHHVARNAVACFLTRGDLWISWEDGLQHFLKYLLDADWSVCAGNWMWVSSSAFEQLLDCSQCVCPVSFGRRLDPYGEYVRRYVPELHNLPTEYLYEPWKASIDVQNAAGCIVGRDYPERMVDHATASKRNKEAMIRIRRSLETVPDHCCPSSEDEVRRFMWLQETEHMHYE